MAFKDVKNTAYNQLIALAEAKKLRKAMISNATVYFVAEDSLEALSAMGITPLKAGEAVLTQLRRHGIYDASGYPLTFGTKDVSRAIERASPNDKKNYLLVSSVAVNAPDLPYTEATRREVDARKLMLR